MIICNKIKTKKNCKCIFIYLSALFAAGHMDVSYLLIFMLAMNKSGLWHIEAYFAS